MWSGTGGARGDESDCADWGTGAACDLQRQSGEQDHRGQPVEVGQVLQDQDAVGQELVVRLQVGARHVTGVDADAVDTDGLDVLAAQVGGRLTAQPRPAAQVVEALGYGFPVPGPARVDDDDVAVADRLVRLLPGLHVLQADVVAGGFERAEGHHHGAADQLGHAQVSGGDPPGVLDIGDEVRGRVDVRTGVVAHDELLEFRDVVHRHVVGDDVLRMRRESGDADFQRVAQVDDVEATQGVGETVDLTDGFYLGSHASSETRSPERQQRPFLTYLRGNGYRASL